MNKVNEKPILFSADMVNAILEGRKTQTRRVIKPQPPFIPDAWDSRTIIKFTIDSKEYTNPYASKIGDRLWVRETWGVHHTFNHLKPSEIPANPANGTVVFYKATDPLFGIEDGDKWRPSIFMPRWASRITLKINDVRVERVQDITYSGVKAEGVLPHNIVGGSWETLINNYWIPLWDSINKKRGYGWDTNPYVWVIDFEVCR